MRNNDGKMAKEVSGIECAFRCRTEQHSHMGLEAWPGELEYSEGGDYPGCWWS